MSFEVYRTTAEHVVGVVDAALQLPEGVDAELISRFLDTTTDSGESALKMAVQLRLLKEAPAGKYSVDSPCALYLSTSSRHQKTSVFRFVLEQYKPYRTFKSRLNMNTGVPISSSEQTRALHSISAHRDVIMHTFISLGTYTDSISSQGGGLYLASEEGSNNYLVILNAVINDREQAESTVRSYIGYDEASWIDPDTVLSHIVTAYQRLGTVNEDQRAPIVHAGNAIESFLTQVAVHFNVSLAGANGINAKVDKLTQSGNLAKKHGFMCKYLGHVRNAAEHGSDPAIGVPWDVSANTSIQYVHVAQTTISAIVKCIRGGAFTV